MRKLLFPLLIIGAAGCMPVLAQVQAPATVQEVAATKTPLMDNTEGNGRIKVVAKPNLFAAPVVTRPLKIAVYFGGGSPESNSKMLMDAGKRLEGAEAVKVTAEEFSTIDLSKFDVVVFPGGSGSGQAKALGEVGRENVRKFVKNGGGYLGICAGAYLATSGYPWSLSILNAKTVQPWARGGGAVALQMTDEGKDIIGKVDETFPVRYNNGPVIQPDDKADLPPYKVVAYFRDELANKKEQEGQMKDTPAIVTADFGAGKVMTISPHFEGTKNMENVLPTVLAWLAPAKK